MSGQRSLARRLAGRVMVGFAVVWLLALVATALVLRAELDEASDKIIRETAQVLLPTLAADYRQRLASGSSAAVEIAVPPRVDPDGEIEDGEEAPIYRLLDGSGAVLMTSSAPASTVFPERAGHGYARTTTHIFYNTAPNGDGFVMQVGEPRQERISAYFDSLFALLIPMLAILPLAYLLVRWIGREALAPLDRFRSEIADRGDTRLDPIDAAGQPAELQAIASALNGFMIRLALALDSERAFATSAAHELRTPVAVALAQVQRLRAEARDDETGRLLAVEEALKRMSRLVARLLQLARADAGIGLSEAPQDVGKVLELVLDDSRRDPARAGRLKVVTCKAPVPSRIDPDAFAMAVGNLIDNAFQHSPPGTPVEIALTADGLLRITNDGPVIPEPDLSRLTGRFQRGSPAGAGFGLGLHIADTIARQSHGELSLHSPPGGRAAGLEVRFKVPVEGADAGAS